MKILGIVITYKETKFCEKAIKSLVNSGADVALVFNGWNSEYLKWFDRIYGYIDYKFLNKGNVGFCKGNNMAIELALKRGYDYIFLLNNDAYIKQDCLEELVKVMNKDEKIGLAQPKVYKAWNKKILDTTGHIFKYGDRYSWDRGFGGLVDRGEYEEDAGQYDKERLILSCSGCSVLYRAKMLRTTGLFWEKLWSIGEDAEIGWRAYKKGWKASYAPEAIAYHWRGYTGRSETNKKIKKLWEMLFYRNFVYIMRRHGNPRQIKLTSAAWIYTGCKSFVGKILRRNDVGGYFVWLCGLALLDDKVLGEVEKKFREMFKNY